MKSFLKFHLYFWPAVAIYALAFPFVVFHFFNQVGMAEGKKLYNQMNEFTKWALRED